MKLSSVFSIVYVVFFHEDIFNKLAYCMFDTLNNFRGFTLCLFQDFLNSLLLGILLFVFFTVVCIILGGAYSRTGALSYRFSELFCILIPILFLSLQLLLSICCLYQASSLDTSCDITVKITGHQ